jgi:hypothetical protein
MSRSFRNVVLACLISFLLFRFPFAPPPVQGETPCPPSVPRGADTAADDPGDPNENGGEEGPDNPNDAGGVPNLTDVGNNNPVGVSGIFNGSSTTGCSIEMLSFNARREVTDIVVPGCVGAYPLKLTRYHNSRGGHQFACGMSYGWSHSYSWFLDPDRGTVGLPDGGEIPGGLCTHGWPPISENWDRNDPTRFRLADGGTVMNGPGGTLLLVDPFGQTTTIERNEVNVNGAISKVTEPGGRYLKFIYTNLPSYRGNTEHLLTRVEAWDGIGTNPAENLMDWVNYTYSLLFESGNQCHWLNLAGVQYSDGTSASYTYVHTNEHSQIGYIPSGYPNLKSCQDVRYHSAMRGIIYEYQGDRDDCFMAPHGAVKREISWGGVIVSSVDGQNETRTESTRGNAVSRQFHYTSSNVELCCNPPSGELCDLCASSVGDPQYLERYTDFKGETTYLGYDDETKFVTSVTDARGTGPGDTNYTTTYTRDLTDPGDGGIGQITTITHPDTTHIDYAYETDPHYIHRITDERGSYIVHTRESDRHRIMQTDYYDVNGNRLAYETFDYDDGHGHGPG